MKYLFYILFFFGGSLFGQNQALFDQATRAYSEGNYEQAIKNYEQILENGKTSVAVYYNLANAHHKLNHLAPSIYYYEKALQLDPADQDVKNNLAIARKNMIDVIEPLPESDISRWANRFISLFGFDGWAWLAIVFSFLFAFLIIGYFFARSPQKKRLFFVPALMCFLLCILAFSFAFVRQGQAQSQRFAIVFSQEAKVTAEPSPRSEMRFLLHEGTKVKILETFNNWHKIELADGKQGWVPKEKVRGL